MRFPTTLATLRTNKFLAPILLQGKKLSFIIKLQENSELGQKKRKFRTQCAIKKILLCYVSTTKTNYRRLSALCLIVLIRAALIADNPGLKPWNHHMVI